jgi:phospholipid transport system substrate-binding protein
MKSISGISLLLAFVLAALPARAEELNDEPMRVLKQNTDKIQELVLKSKTDDEMRENVKGLMEAFVNFEEFGELCLGKEWETLSADQRKAYLGEFKALLQRTYLRRFKPGKEFTVKYRSETRFNKGKDRAEILTTIISGDVEADVDYRFHSAGGWRVYDIVVDEVSIMRNYRKSFLKVLRKDGFDALITKMKSKTSEEDEE